jgi:hypothetical protein
LLSKKRTAGVRTLTRAIAVKQPYTSKLPKRKIHERTAPNTAVNKIPGFDFTPLAGSAARINAVTSVPPDNSAKSTSPFQRRPSKGSPPEYHVRKLKTERNTPAAHEQLILNTIMTILPARNAAIPLSAIMPGARENSRST